MNLLYWKRLYKNMFYAALYIKPLAVQIVTPSIEPVKSICNSRIAGLQSGSARFGNIVVCSPEPVISNPSQIIFRALGGMNMVAR
jgi:hypothetical protein